jgi:hypothetical protein
MFFFFLKNKHLMCCIVPNKTIKLGCAIQNCATQNNKNHVYFFTFFLFRLFYKILSLSLSHQRFPLPFVANNNHFSLFLFYASHHLFIFLSSVFFFTKIIIPPFPSPSLPQVHHHYHHFSFNKSR